MCRLFFIVLFVLAPCSLFAFWPLSWELGKEKRFIGPLVSYDEKNNERHIVFRPLLSSYDSEEGGTVEYLYPLGKVTPEKSYFIPIYKSNTSSDASDTAFLLFFFGTSPEGSYGGFFPLAGTLKKRFTRDEMGFFLWPLFSYTKNEGATKTNIAWPFFSIYSGAEEGFKAWPLYGTRQRPGVRHSQFFLWPLGFKEEKNLDTDNPIDTFYFLPFYLSSVSRLHETRSVFYPFFTYRRTQDKEEWNHPWPFFSTSTGPETKGFTFFPFYSEEKFGRDRKFYFLWPIYSEKEWYFKEERYSRKSVLIINRYIEEENATFFNIWPFFEYREKEGDYLFLFPSVLPFRDRGFDRIVKPLITIYEQRREQGVLTSNFLYGFYTREEQGENWRMRFAFLLELSHQDGEPGFEILSGFFGIDGKRVKVLYIPFDRPADPPAAAPAHAETHPADRTEDGPALQQPPSPAADKE
ncbi:MAG TPA: hypothetical protein PLR60_01585 [Syntrophorhabdaceae bacterium]|nr:hypothetical protein [Syntrophorhabdaceae bacterium]